MFLTITPLAHPGPVASPRWGQDINHLGPTLMQRGGGSDTPLPQVLSTLGHFTSEGDEEILNAGSVSSSDQVTNLALPSWLFKCRF